MKHDVKIFVQNCLVCQQAKYQALALARLLQPLPIPGRIWEDVSLDFIVGLPKSGAFDTILVVVGRLSNSFQQELFRLSQTRLRMGTSYIHNPHRWSEYLPWANFSFNTSFHSSTETTSFKVVYGRDPPSISPFVHGETGFVELEEQLLNHEVMLKILKDNLLMAQTRMNQQANSHSHHRDVTFQVGDSIFLPYELELPASPKVHPTFHVSLLFPAHGQQAVIPPTSLPLTEYWELAISPAKILAHRWVKDAGASSLELLVQWVECPLKKLVGRIMISLKIFLPFALRTRRLFRGMH
ncbi:hypothetical protein KY290_032533 [Solanum tuberosum]|uniref:Uncharacterized protein n=1 Tax=Solanum tuberosum TaxID=4113 RepID=A0ABQ7UCE4_SOLTU|nr:hypothetical protein KY290_032533 [Solanum tuberosum]